MADNSLQNGTDTIRDLGRQAGTVKTQVMQIDIGGATANAEILVTAGQQTMAASLPMVIASNQTPVPISVLSQPEGVTTGTITTTDIVVSAPSTTGVPISGTPTAGSYVAANATGGNASVVIGITGLTTGTIYYEGSADSTTGVDGVWVALNMKQAGYVNTQISSSATTNGLYRGNTAGIRYIRMRSVGALTGTPAITLRLSSGVAGEFLFGSIPTGLNLIGDTNGRQFVPTTDVIMQNAAVAVGNGTVLAVAGYGTAMINIAGTFTGSTIIFEGTQDGTNYFAEAATQLGASSISSTATVPGIYRLSVSGLTNIRARISVFGTGTITASGRATNAPYASKFIQLVPSTNTIGTVNFATPTAFSLSSAATTNATSVKATAGTVFQVAASNVGAAAVFLKLFNLATAPTVGTSVPFLTIPIAPSGVVSIPFGELGMRFTTGIAFSITNLVADADATVIAAAQVKVAISYI